MGAGVYLFVWSIVAIHGSQYGQVYETRYQWQNQGLFADTEVCKQTAVSLNIKPEFVRCISNRTGK